jgi:ribosomal protein S18 acetylase RimI-like enzyme
MDAPSAGAPITTRVLRAADDLIVEAVDRLVFQLSDSASAPGRWELERIVANPDVMVLVAESATVIVGLVAVVVYRTPRGIRSRIEDLVVDQFVDVPGVTERLIRRAMKTSESRGARTLEVNCSVPELARIYERLGFERRSTTAYQFKISG